MQSVRLKKSLTFPRLAPRSTRTRQFPSFLSALLIAAGLLPWAFPALAQDTQAVPAAPEAKERFDVGLAGLYQVTNASNGNFLRDDTTESGGVLVSFRQPYRPWLGYEADLSYTKFYEAYNKGIVKVESNVTDLSFSYLLQSPAHLRGSAIRNHWWRDYRFLPHIRDAHQFEPDRTELAALSAAPGVHLFFGPQDSLCSRASG